MGRVKGPVSDDAARAMYKGGRANVTAQRFARVWGLVFASGLGPRRWVRLEVPGRRTGRLMRIPIGLADLGGRWYAVSMLGECNWTRNVRFNGGHAVLRHLTATPVEMVEVPAGERPPILRRYLQVAPGGRPHIPATVASSDHQIAALADRYPVYVVRRADGSGFRPRRSWCPAAAVGAVLVWMRWTDGARSK